MKSCPMYKNCIWEKIKQQSIVFYLMSDICKISWSISKLSTLLHQRKGFCKIRETVFKHTQTYFAISRVPRSNILGTENMINVLLSNEDSRQQLFELLNSIFYNTLHKGMRNNTFQNFCQQLINLKQHSPMFKSLAKSIALNGLGRFALRPDRLCYQDIKVESKLDLKNMFDLKLIKDFDVIGDQLSVKVRVKNMYVSTLSITKKQ